MRSAGWFGLALLLFAATAVGAPKLRTHVNYGSLRSAKPKAGEPVGCIAGSVGRAVTRNDHAGVSLVFQRSEFFGTRKQMIDVRWSESMWMHFAEITEGDSVRDVFLACVAPGEYGLSQIEIMRGAGRALANGFDPIRITVEAGKVQYIGSFLAGEPDAPLSCTRNIDGAILLHHDDRVVDLPLIERFAEGRPVVPSLIDISTTRAPIIPCTPAERAPLFKHR